MCVDGKPHNLVSGAPIVHGDGSKSPTLVCTKCSYSTS